MRTIKFALIICMLLLFTGCSSKPLIFTDTAERPEIEDTGIVPLEYAKYPEKPTSLPEVDSTTLPKMGSITVNEGSNYKVEGNKVTYKDVKNWDYIYVGVDNFHKEYANVKFTINGEGANKIAIQAIYNEMYDNEWAPATLLIGNVSNGTQYYVSKMTDKAVMDENYNEVPNKYLGDQRIIGFVLFVDSNPTQSAPVDREGSITIESIDFYKDGDPELDNVYVEPKLTIGGYCDPGYSTTEEDGVITISRGASAGLYTRAFLPIQDYSMDYTTFTMNIETEGVTNLVLEMEINPKGNPWQTTVAIGTKSVVDGETTIDIDFGDLEPTGEDWNSVPGYAIKNYDIKSLIVYMDTTDKDNLPSESATLKINSMKFNRTSSDENVISDLWTGSDSIVVQDDVVKGGVGTVKFDSHSAWWNLVIPVNNYKKANTLTIEVEAKDGLDFFAVAVVSGGNAVTLRSTWDVLEAKDDVITSEDDATKGMTQTITYNSTTKTFKFVFDFSSITLDNPLNENTISQIQIYLNNAGADENYNFEGHRTLRFTGIKFE